MPVDPRDDEAAAIADRRPIATTSDSEGVRLLDRLARLFGAPHETKREPATASLFLWGPLEVRRALGQGSFGEVYAAWDPTLQREVALKLRSPEVGTLRWLDEARNLARIRHANVLTVHGADVLDGRAGIWTELIGGRTLEEELAASGPFAEAEVVRIGRDVASALSAVHAAGLIHGDVKTTNVMLEDGVAPRRAVLVDFGSADLAVGDDDIPAYTIGTPLTMAPEVLEGRPASASSDVYGLGATLFRLLTGRYPVEATSIDELRRAHESRERPRVRAVAPQVSVRLARALERALEIDPVQRWPSALAFRRALDDVADPTRRIRARAAAIGAGVAALAAVTVVAILIARPGPGPISKAILAAPRMPNLFRETWRYAPKDPQEGFAWVTAVPDLDGDGRADIVAAQTHWKDGDGVIRGRVFVFRGTVDGPASTESVSWPGERPESLDGAQVTNAGDVNADGFDDLLIAEQPLQTSRGRVRLCLGGPSIASIVPTWSFEGESRDSHIGYGMASAGDVNRDGYDDVVISESEAGDSLEFEGIVRVFAGTPSGLAAAPVWTARGGKADSELGAFMHRLGDVNGDGFDDVLVGAYAWDGAAPDCGQARLYFGNKNGVDTQPAWTFDGAGPNSHLGTTCAGAGDVNADGFDDMLVSEPQYSDEGRPERGRALLFLGGRDGPARTPDWVAMGPAAYSHFSYCLLGIGDVDGDGFGDIAITATQYTEGKRIHLGMIEVYRGGAKGCESVPSWRAIGDNPDCHLGNYLAAGDMNGDGIPDLVACAPFCGSSSPQSGVLFAYLGQRHTK
jgi:hypothetical protein